MNCAAEILTCPHPPSGALSHAHQRHTIGFTVKSRKPSRLIIRSIYLMLVTVAALLCSSNSRADDANIVPFVEVREEFNDNIFFSVEEPASDFITTISPGVDLIEATERLNASVTGQINQLLYLDNNDLDATDFYFLGTLDYLTTPRLGLYTEAGYIKDSRPDRDVDQTGFVQDAEPRKRFHFDLKGNYETSENIFNNLRYRLETNNYEDPEFTDSVINDLQFGHTWYASRWVANTIGRLNLGYTHYNFEEADTYTIAATIGAEWYQSEKISLILDVGARFVESRFEETVFVPTPPFFVTREVTTSTWGGIGQLTFVYRGEDFSSTAAFLNDLREAGGRGGTVLRTALDVTHNHRILEKLRAYAAAGFNINEALEGKTAAEDIDERSVYFRPSLRYEINEHWEFDLGYNVTWVQDRVDNEEAVRNKIFAQLRYQWPIWDR